MTEILGHSVRAELTTLSNEHCQEGGINPCSTTGANPSLVQARQLI